MQCGSQYTHKKSFPQRCYCDMHGTGSEQAHPTRYPYLYIYIVGCWLSHSHLAGCVAGCINLVCTRPLTRLLFDQLQCVYKQDVPEVQARLVADAVSRKLQSNGRASRVRRHLAKCTVLFWYKPDSTAVADSDVSVHRVSLKPRITEC